MNSHLWIKRVRGRSLAIGILMAALLITVAPARQVAWAGGRGESTELVNPGPGGEVDRWWGAVGAVLCGIEANLIRTVPAVGFQPGLLAMGIGGCILAAMDICTTQ